MATQIKRVETALEENDYKNFERACLDQDISMRKKTKQLILSFLGGVGKKTKKSTTKDKQQ